MDGAPRVACVTPLRRLEGRQVTTLDGLPAADRERWADALVATGGSQCGFCTPGIVMRLAGLARKAPRAPSGAAGAAGLQVGDEQIDEALVAHLCRCTGWQTIREAARWALDGPEAQPAGAPTGRDLGRAVARATLEGGVAQDVGPEVVLGRAGFADDTAPSQALVAVPDGIGGYTVAASPREARSQAGKVQGRRTSLGLTHPVALPGGRWDLVLQTTWVEPGYVEPDASWCVPGGEPASPYGNGGAFGGKLHSPVMADARRLADEHGRPVRVLWSREDVVGQGPKRPPVAGGIRADGAGVLRVGIPTEGVPAEEWASVMADVARVAPAVVVEPVPLTGPPVSLDLRGSVWAEAAVLVACAPWASAADDADPFFRTEITSPGGGWAAARFLPDGSVEVEVDAGRSLDEVVLRSYCVGAAHQAMGWVRSEGIAVDHDGASRDLTIRSFGILRARDTPQITVALRTTKEGEPVNGSDAVFAAVAASCWRAAGLPPRWPVDRSSPH